MTETTPTRFDDTSGERQLLQQCQELQVLMSDGKQSDRIREAHSELDILTTALKTGIETIENAEKPWQTTLEEVIFAAETLKQSSIKHINPQDLAGLLQIVTRLQDLVRQNGVTGPNFEVKSDLISPPLEKQAVTESAMPHLFKDDPEINLAMTDNSSTILSQEPPQKLSPASDDKPEPEDKSVDPDEYIYFLDFPKLAEKHPNYDISDLSDIRKLFFATKELSHENYHRNQNYQIRDDPIQKKHFEKDARLYSVNAVNVGSLYCEIAARYFAQLKRHQLDSYAKMLFYTANQASILATYDQSDPEKYQHWLNLAITHAKQSLEIQQNDPRYDYQSEQYLKTLYLLTRLALQNNSPLQVIEYGQAYITLRDAVADIHDEQEKFTQDIHTCLTAICRKISNHE